MVHPHYNAGYVAYYPERCVASAAVQAIEAWLEACAAITGRCGRWPERRGGTGISVAICRARKIWAKLYIAARIQRPVKRGARDCRQSSKRISRMRKPLNVI